MTAIKNCIIPIGLARPGIKRPSLKGVTIHETGNTGKGAGAISHAEYLQSIAKTHELSWHYCVDDTIITQSIPESEVAWCAGDGNGNGNMRTINIEICINPESNFEKARQNAAELTADILVRNGIKTAKGWVFQHYDWSGKNCPENIRKKGLWPDFLNRVQSAIDKKKTPPKPPTIPSETVYTVVKGDTLSGIATKYKTTYQKLAEYNKIADPNKITVGQKIKIPGTSTAPPPSTAPKFVVGGKVKIKPGAGKYSRSSVTIPAMYKGKPYTIQQIGANDVLLHELYSWVNKADCEGV